MKNISIFAFSLLVLFSACKKDDSSDLRPAPNSKKLVRMTYNDEQYGPETVEYDAQGRVTKYADDEDVTTFKYEGNEVQINEWRLTENREVFSFKGQLNSKGNLISGSGLSQYNLSAIEQVEFTFEYNAAGYMVRKTRNGNQGANVYVYDYTYNSRGDMTEVKVFLNGVYSYGGTWEYDITRPYKVGLNWEQFNGPNTFTGKPNQHMAVKYTGNTGWYVNMAYTYDNQGYPLSNTLVYSNGNTYKLFYEYE
jgi:hypothetical protein